MRIGKNFAGGKTTSAGGLQGTSQITLKLTDLKVANLGIRAGPSGKTRLRDDRGDVSARIRRAEGGVVNGTRAIP